MPIYTMKEYHLLNANKMGLSVFRLVSVDQWNDDRETEGEEDHGPDYYFEVNCKEVKDLGIVHVRPDDLKLDGFDLPDIIGY